LAAALREAGWPEELIEARAVAASSHEPINLPTSPGVGPDLERHLRELADRIAAAMSSLGHSSQDKVAFVIDPKAGVHAWMNNVIMTDEGIVGVSSFLFRWCGLIARAFIRTLNLDVLHWSETPPDAKRDGYLLLSQPDLALYWLQIFASFSTTGTHAFAPFRPSRPDETLIFEQIAWAMEFFVVAHEFGHHALNHRSIDASPIAQEYEADSFAIKICEKLEMEPFPLIQNPYNTTGAGASLMIRSLSTLNLYEEYANRTVIDHRTHPPTSERIKRIANRHALQPHKLATDRNFNDTVARIMDAVDDLAREFLVRGGAKLILEARTKIRA
jgi:hypothetical protein